MRAGNMVFLHADSEKQAADLDNLLWTFNSSGFLAHDIWLGQSDDPPCSILIGTTEPPAEHHNILINLSNESPNYFSSFERLLEIVGPDNTDAGRQRYQYYRDRGYPLETHKL